ncbi:MAG TPA: PA2779 family protein [Solimonas sp.]|nr:PA2779 family protein [Solimonas sp.]
MKNTKIKEFVLGTTFATLVAVGVPVPAQAGMIGTDQLVQQQQHALKVSQVQQWMTREDVRQQLQALGVDLQQATERVNALTDQELQQLALNMDAQPAGGDAIAIIGIVFLVLLILELVGVTNIFNKI